MLFAVRPGSTFIKTTADKSEPTTTALNLAAYLPAAFALCLFAVIVAKTAWISDDAYITFRTVDNFVHGHGLVWNVGERVQSFTHPLWMLLLTAGRAITGEIHFTAMTVCMLLSLAVVAIVGTRLAIGPLAAVTVVLMLALSKAFTDYSTSGLENPLTHLLLVLFAWRFLTREPTRRSFGWLALLAGLLITNRMDTILLVLPALAAAFWSVRGWKTFGRLLLGFLPFIAWEVFALIYYGFPFPNTAYAKLNTGVDAFALFTQGWFYLVGTFTLDPLTIVVLATGLLTPILARHRGHLALAAGALLYVLYVMRIGGDFMAGRFLTAPLLIAVILIARVRMPTIPALVTLALVLVVGIVPQRSPLTSEALYGVGMKGQDAHGIADERAAYFEATSLLSAARGVQVPESKFVDSGREARAAGERVIVRGRIGLTGFFAGPDVYVVDRWALADPLLARLPPLVNEDWRIGHIPREIPRGYLASLRSDENRIADAEIAALWEELRLITRGPIWAADRWRAIWRLLIQPTLVEDRVREA